MLHTAHCQSAPVNTDVKPHVMTVAKPRKLSSAKRHAQIESISILGAVGRMGPIGLWQYAEAYLKAAKAVPLPDVPYEPTRYFLVCHSIELGLKAFLSVQGATMLQLSENAYGHNLDALLKAAEGERLLSTVQLSGSQRDQIAKASDYYAGKVFQYPAVAEALRAYPGLPDIETLFAAAECIVKSLEIACKEAL
jgi:hypothetical protein